uniref:CSON001076 protein n=1 Tax=Culicoides sonorensis TaxID=179676 RepID=A0A336KVQ1_CULSO
MCDNEPPASLSDFHDYEPNLEFDDTELSQAPPPQLLNYDVPFDDDTFQSGDFNSDHDIKGLEADNYEDQLKVPELDEEIAAQSDFAKYKFIDYIGTDKHGQPIIAIYACKLPDRKKIVQDVFIKFIIKSIEQYVQNDYSIAYFHQGLKENSKPSTTFLWNSYRELDRNFKKNLKQLYVVHPTTVFRCIWWFFRPLVSEKFRKKLIYTSSLDELKVMLGLKHLNVPEGVREFDDMVNANSKTRLAAIHASNLSLSQLPKTTQFGVTLKFINDNSPCLNYIPPVVRMCVDHLSVSDVIDTEGIFRRSGNKNRINELKEIINTGKEVQLCDENTHDVSSLLKTFLRELQEPLLTFELYDEIIEFLNWPKDERSRNVKLILREKLPVENYELFKYLVEFLVKVMDRKDFNKMTSSNLAIVFAPNLIYAKNNQMSLDEVAPINAFVDFVLQNHEDIYIMDINKTETLD